MPLSQEEILNNRYHIVKLLGQGGFGAVYRAWDTNLEVPVAIKENLDISPAAQKQFKREAQILFNLHHPNLPRVHDHFVSPGQGQYLVMDFVEGQDLGEMLRNGPLPEVEVLPWIIQVCDALSYLHSQDPPVIHRDIKPGNIKITPEGKAMLVDFGISKIYDPNLATTVGARAVTPGYSPPEQYGKGVTDIRSDLYALGATLYHLLTGHLPPDSVDILTRTAPPPPPVVDLNSSISEAIGNAITKAMALDREARWANADEFKQAITTKPTSVKERGEIAPVAAQVVTPLPPSRVVPARAGIEISGRRISWSWLGVLGFLVLVVVILVIGYFTGKLTPSAFPTTNIGAVLPSDTTAPWKTKSPSTLPVITVAPVASNTLTPSISPTLAADFVDEFGVEMKLIPAGEFKMGGDADRAVEECRKLCLGCSCDRNNYVDEEPSHTVYLDAFYMDIYEVTNSLYALCVEAGICGEPSSRKSYARDSYYGNSTYDDYPVIYVSWEKALNYCEWRGARLPTEAEWEKAARGNLEDKIYPWGDESPECSKGVYNGAKFDDNGSCSQTDTEWIGSYSANGYGLFDMAGNVWEWVMDWYSEDYYASLPSENPTGPPSGSGRCLRGGSWVDFGYHMRVSDRVWEAPSGENINFGFRCARSP